MALDASFLTVVEDFLSSCDLATLSSNLNDDNSSSELPHSGETLMLDKVATTEECVRHKLYRKRRRAEREQLELEIEELNIKLAKEPRRLMSMSGWRMVAMCQLEARLASEQRQRQLQAAISAQTELIQVYQRLTHEQLVHVDSFELGNLHMNHYQRDNVHLESFDAEFYKTSARTFNAVYAQTDEVFASCGIDSTDDNYRTHIQEQRDENGRTYFLYTDKRKFQAGFEDACGMLKQTLSLHQKHDQQFYDGMEDPDRTIAIKFRVTSRLKTGVVASVLLRVINRWYLEDNRMVVVWRVFAEGEGAFAGMHSDEVGWGVLSSLSGTPGKSILRLCARYVPMNFTNFVTRTQEQAGKQFSGMVVETSTSNADEVACYLEKLLLNDAEDTSVTHECN